MNSEAFSADELLAIDAICDRFEAAWNFSEPPRIQDFLAFDGLARRQLLRELIQIDMQRRAAAGMALGADAYADQHLLESEEVRQLQAQSDCSSGDFRVRAWRLKIVRGPHAGETRTLEGAGALAIGRSASCALSLLGDPRCSREHAVIEYSQSHCRITDVGSKNGVYLNGFKTETSPLEPGDTVVLGQTHIRILAE